MLRRCENKNKFYTYMFISSIVGIAIYCGICALLNFSIDSFYFTDQDYYLQPFGKVPFNILCMSCVLSLSFFAEKMLNFIPHIRSLIRQTSSNLTAIYVIHWIIVENGSYFYTERLDPHYVPISLAIFIISAALAQLYKSKIHRQRTDTQKK